MFTNRKLVLDLTILLFLAGTISRRYCGLAVRSHKFLKHALNFDIAARPSSCDYSLPSISIQRVILEHKLGSAQRFDPS